MVSQHLSEGIHRISPLERDIDQYLIHLRVEKGSSENTIASYARDFKSGMWNLWRHAVSLMPTNSHCRCACLYA